MKFFYGLVFLILFSSLTQAQSWRNLGPGEGQFASGGEVSYTSIVLDHNNVPYIASIEYGDNNEGDKITVRKYNGSIWEDVGDIADTAFPEGLINASLPSLAIDMNNVPYLAYSYENDYSDSFSLAIKKYDGNSWVSIISPGFSNVGIEGPSIAIDRHNALYVTYTDSSLKVKIFNSTTWKDLNLNSGDYKGFASYYNPLVLDKNNVPYILYKDSTNIAIVKKYNGTTWEDLGFPIVDLPLLYTYTMAIDGNNVPYVAYSDPDSLGKATVRKFNGNSWVVVGNRGFSMFGASIMTIAIDSKNIPYVTYASRDQANPQVFAQKFNGASWEIIGNQGISEGLASTPVIAIDGNDIPYVVYINEIEYFDFYKDYAVKSDKAIVKKFDGSSWVGLKTSSISSGLALSPAISIDANNVPYLVYSDEDSSYKVTVKKFDGTSWINVGMPGFSDGQVTFPSISIDGNETPYVSYLDSSQAILVKKFDGTSWKSLSNIGLPAGKLNYVSFEIDGMNTPYLVYQDGNDSAKVLAKKFNGSSWISVASQAISSSWGGFTSIAINKDNTPYVIYTGFTEGLKVKKIDGSSWASVGDSGLTSPYFVTNSDIAIGSDKIPYVAYTASSTVFVKKFNGTTWVDMGTVGSSKYISIAIDSDNVPYVVYQDIQNYGKATVKKYNGSSWVEVGLGVISQGIASYPALAIDKLGRPIVAYSSCWAFVQRFEDAADGVVSDNKFSSEENIVLYPNPSSGNFTIKTQEKILEVTLTNFLGQQEKFYTSSIHASGKGLFVVEVKTDKGITRKKLMVE